MATKQQIVFVRTPYNYDRDMASEESGLYCPPEESKTQQNQKDEADINTIVRNFGLTGELPSNVRIPQYGDFTGIESYHDALLKVQAADEAFALLPAAIREKFENSPEQFVEFCSDPNNRSELIDMGLIDPDKVAAAPVAPPAPATPSAPADLGPKN